MYVIIGYIRVNHTSCSTSFYVIPQAKIFTKLPI